MINLNNGCVGQVGVLVFSSVNLCMVQSYSIHQKSNYIRVYSQIAVGVLAMFKSEWHLQLLQHNFHEIHEYCAIVYCLAFVSLQFF